MHNRHRWTIAGLIATPLAFLGAIGVLWWLRFFDFTGTEATAKIVGTALTVGGGLIAAMVTLLGLILRQSVEQRNADLREEADRRLALDADRNKALQEEAERRLKLEAAIRAVALLGTDAGGETNPMQRTGALFSLSHLGLTDLALDLVTFMRPAGLIDPGPTASLLDIAFRSGEQLSQKRAGEFLRDHADLQVTRDAFHWPDYISLVWPPELSFLTKDYVLEGLMRGILSLPRREWDLPSLNAAVVYLSVAFRSEADPRLKANIALFLQEILDIYEAGQLLYLPSENLDIDKLRQQAKATPTEGANTTSIALAGTLKTWMTGEQVVPPRRKKRAAESRA